MSPNSLILHTRVVTGAGGGPEKTILNSHRFLEAAGYRMICAYMRDPRDPGFSKLASRAEDRGAQLIMVDDRGPFDWRVLSSFRRICREHRPDIWHGHDYKSNLLGLLLRRSRRMSQVATVHGWVERTWKTPLYYAIDRFCLRRCQAVVCVSRDLHETCLGLGIPKERCFYVPNAIDIDEFRRSFSIDDAKDRLGIPAERFVVGAVGRLSEEKGFDRLIRAFVCFYAIGVDAELWIAGEGVERTRLSRLASELGIGDRVKLPGYLSDILGLYQAMDAFVLSSIREGLPNVLLEAMALEVPVLSTAVAGVPTLVRDGFNGLLAEPGSIAALASGLERLAEDPTLRRNLGDAGRKTVEESCSFAARMASMRRIYEGIHPVRGSAPA